MKKYNIIFKYREDPWKLFISDDKGICKMGGMEDVVVESNDLDIIKKSLERVRYHACGMSEINILEISE